MMDLSRLKNGVAVYPLSALWGGAVTTMLFYANNKITLSNALILLGVMVVAMFVASTFREVRTVHVLVNSQHTKLVVRIDQLIDTLNKAGVEVPAAPNAESQAETKDDERR